MLPWSIYNNLFTNESYGYFVYNSFSNTFLQLSQKNFNILEKIKNGIDCYIEDKPFIDILKKYYILFNKSDEKLLLDTNLKRNHIRSNSNILSLTIAPTLGCNFRCPYCTQNSQSDNLKMSKKTINRIIYFIQSFKNITSLNIKWFGGEPLLAFDIIENITEEIEKLNIQFSNYSMITNGYLLYIDKIDKLNDLKIKNIQITLDGLEQIHDKTRYLANKNPTYNKIIKNIDNLMSSSYKGICTIRSNIDKNNSKYFDNMRDELISRYKDKESIYLIPEPIDFTEINTNISSNFNKKEWTQFQFKQAEFLDIDVYPKKMNYICTANQTNSFVIGPEGELYKCYLDIGVKNKRIGNINNQKFINNLKLINQYGIEMDPYIDTECKKCDTLPICGGGCANFRLKNKVFNDLNINYCSKYKDKNILYSSLIKTFEEQLKIDRAKELLNYEKDNWKKYGFRIIKEDSNSIN